MGHIPSMQVFLDGQPLDVAKPGVADALDAGSQVARAAGRLVVEVHADGAQLTDEQLDAFLSGAGTGRPSELRLVTADARALVVSSLVDGAQVLRDTRDDYQRVAELLQADRQHEALAGLNHVLHVWQAVRDLVDNVEQLSPVALRGVAVERASRGGAAVGASGGGGGGTDNLTRGLERLARHLENVRGALAGQDWAAVADVVAYDLREEAQAWEQLLDALAKHVGTLAPPGQK